MAYVNDLMKRWEEDLVSTVCTCKNLWECPLRSLHNHLTFPPITLLSDYNDPSALFYTGFDEGYIKPSRHWCFLGKIQGTGMHPFRPSAVLEDKLGESITVTFYHDRFEYPMTFDWDDIRPGYTMAILYCEKKNMLDLTVGIRAEHLNSIFVFKGSLEYITKQADLIGKRVCFHCKKNCRKKCGKCGIAKYCSKECQVAGWKGGHNKLCQQFSMLQRMADLTQRDYNGFISFLNI